MRLLVAVSLCAGLFATHAIAQHDHSEAVEVQPVQHAEGHHAADGNYAETDSHVEHASDGAHDGQTDVIELPHGRHGSGTSWLPDSSPSYMEMWENGGWQWMLHGAAHLSYTRMNGPRGDEGIYSPNWLMLRGMRPEGCDGQLELSGMFSLDPLTVGGAGYPLLFQTGETWQGLPLKDHQHPHNYFSELSIKYKWRLACDQAAFLYVAPVGEPALGPPAFMHRQLALDYPASPLGHHWQDATHIAYGVVTAGVQSREWQVEASVFNGQEPGEERYAIDAPTFDSFSGRVSWNPGKNVAMQVSHGELSEPEPTHPGQDVSRTTASMIYNHDLGCDRSWQTALVWGRNATDDADFDSYLIESSLKQDGGWSPYFRFEVVEKSAEELVLPEPQFDHHEKFALKQGTLGLTVDLGDKGDWQWGIGGAYVFNLSPVSLNPVYGSNPDGWNIYLRGHPRRMKHADHDSHASHPGHADSQTEAVSEESQKIEADSRPNAEPDTSQSHGEHDHGQ